MILIIIVFLYPQLLLSADTYEPNNSFAEAYGKLTSGVTYYSYIYSGTDDDYYFFYVADTGNIYVTLQSSFSVDLPDNFDIYLYDADENLEDSSTNPGTSGESITYNIATGAGPGKYYIKVGSPGTEYSTTTCYALCVTFPVVTTIPKAVVTKPAEEYVTVTGIINVDADVYGSPYQVKFYYRKKGETSWSIFAEDFTFPANQSTVDLNTDLLTNDTIYELKAVAYNEVGTDPDPYITWFILDRDPLIRGGEIDEVKLNGNTLSTFNGIYFIKDGELRIKTEPFVDHKNDLVEMDTSLAALPTITLTLSDGTTLYPTAQGWDVSASPAQYFCISTFTISATLANGIATLSISKARNINGYFMEPFSYSKLYIDTTKPEIASIQIDEDGDGAFEDNNGYVSNGEQPRIIITFNEPLRNETPGFELFYASYQPSGMEYQALTKVGWLSGSNQTIYVFEFPAPADVATGDGWCKLLLKNGYDIAGNKMDEFIKEKAMLIDATPPSAPIIISPEPYTTVDIFSPVSIILQTPIETDIEYALFSDGVVSYYDYVAPYQITLPIPEGFPGIITVRYADKAGNLSASSSLSLNLNPIIDATPPKASVYNVNDFNFPSIILTAVVNEPNANIEKVEFQYSPDKSNWVSIGTDSYYPDGFQVIWDVSTLSTGIYYIRAVATDKFQNTDPSPPITTVNLSREGLDVSIKELEVSKVSIFSVKAEMNPENKSLEIYVNSSEQPEIALQLYNPVVSKREQILASSITLTGSSGNWKFSLTNDFISNETIAIAHIFVKKSSGEVIFKKVNFGVIPIDPSNPLEFRGDDLPFTIDVLTQPNSIKNKTYLIVKAVETPPSYGNKLLPLGQTYELSFADGTKEFQPIILVFRYPNLSLTNNLFPMSSANQDKLTVCFWDGSKWSNEGLVMGTIGATDLGVTTNHFSKFSIVADYSNPEVKNVKFTGKVISGKLYDLGSGISITDTNVEIGGVRYSISGYGSYNKLTGDFHITVPLTTAKTYNYTLTVYDNTRNVTKLSGSMYYSAAQALEDVHSYPNPFNPAKEVAKIQFVLGEAADVSITIYDFNGDLVSTVVKDEFFSAGLNEVNWNGKNDRGETVANGVYFCQVLAGKNLGKIFKIAVVR